MYSSLLSLNLGIFIATCVNSVIIKSISDLQATQWRVALGMQIVPALLLIILVSCIPYSPRWLAEKGRHKEGQAVIAKLRGLSFEDSDVVAEYKEIEASIEHEKTIGESTWRELFKRSNRRIVFIAIVNQTLQQLTGINIILYYSDSIFKAMGFSSDFRRVTFPIGNALVNFLCTFPGMWAVDRYGRKPLLIWGGLLMALAHILGNFYIIIACIV